MRAVLAVTLILGGCVHAHRIPGPNPSRETYSISCPGGGSSCYSKAGIVCSHGYRIVDRSSMSTGAIHLGHGVFSNTNRTELVVECRRPRETKER